MFSKISKFLALVIALNISIFAQSWQNISTLPVVQDVNSICVVDANTIWVACTGGKVLRSTNGGFNWSDVSTGLTGDQFGIFAFDGTTCWAGNVAGSIFKTTNGGTSWTNQLTVAGSFSNGIKMFNPNYGVYYGDPTGSGQPYQFRTTTNGGTSWVLSGTAPIAGNEFGVINAWDWTDSLHFWVGSANLTANAPNAKIYTTSTGFTGTWTSATVAGTGGAAGLYYQAIAFINASSGMAGSNGNNIMRTTNGGVSWTAASLPSGVTTFAAINMNGFKDGSGIIRLSLQNGASYQMFRTTNLGVSWTEETLPAIVGVNGVQHMQFVNQNLGFGGGAIGTISRWGAPVGINPTITSTPSTYSLEQNYPNPFNPSTNITYSVPNAGNVSIKIYNNLGKEMMTVINNHHAVGNYIESVNMSGFPSGIYFYTLTSGDFKETKKMMLIK